MRKTGCVLAAALAVSCAHAAEAPAPCVLQQALSMNMTPQINGMVSVLAELNSKPVPLAIDTGSPYTAIAMHTAIALNANAMNSGGEEFVNNIKTGQMSVVGSFKLGPIELARTSVEIAGLGAVKFGPKITLRPVILIPDTMVPSWLGGLLGQDAMREFDVEFDYYHSKFNLFLHNTCSANAAYWTKGPVAIVPFEVNHDQHIVIDTVLDGKKVRAVLDTGASLSTMSVDTAKDMFGLRDGDPRLKVVRNVAINGGKNVPISNYPFATLGFEGVAVSNPQIDLIPDKSFGDEPGVDLVVGANVLRRLRMYIAYEQNKIYLTDAQAK